MVKIRVYDIKWDTSTDDGSEPKTPEELGLPSSMEFSFSEEKFDQCEMDGTLEYEISDMVTDQYGFCHNGFQFESKRTRK